MNFLLPLILFVALNTCSSARRNRRICSCGERGPTNSKLPTKIINGEEATPGEWPFMVMLKSKGDISCGASLINESYALTAAHCVEYADAKEGRYKLFFRDHDETTPDEINHRARKVVEVIIHEGYDTETIENDIALLRFEPSLNFVESNIKDGPRPVCLPKQPKSYANRNAIVMGWGSITNYNEPVYPDVLLQTQVIAISHKQCRQRYGYTPKVIFKSMICVAGIKGTDACRGDSGGPLITQAENGNWEQIGIVSWGYGCAKKKYPGVFTRVTKYLRWIKKNAPGNYCD